MSAVRYSVDPDLGQLQEAISLFEFVGGNTDEALRIAINKSAPKIRTLASSKIREQVRLQAGYVRERLLIKKATRKALSGAVQTSARGLLLSRFSTDAQVASDGIRWIRPPAMPAGGIKVKVKPDGGSKAVSGKPFYMVLKNSRAIGIMVRDGDKIKTLYGPSLSQVFDDVRGDVLPEAGAEFTRQLIDAMRYVLVKKYPPEPVDD